MAGGSRMDDAGSRASGRYQAGGALYLYDITTLNDIFYVSGGGDIEFNQHNDGNQNGSLYYSIPFGYWALGLYGSQSQYRQLFRGNWSQTDYKSKIATIARRCHDCCLTPVSKNVAGFPYLKSTSHYYFGGEELRVMRKQNPTWELTLRQQRYFDKKSSPPAGLQRRLPWLNSVATPEEKAGQFSKRSRVVHADLQALMKFDLTGDRFSYAPHFNAQYSRTFSLRITNLILATAGRFADLMANILSLAIRDGTGAMISSGILPARNSNSI